MHPHYRGVAFLLSLGSLPIACGKDPEVGEGSTGAPGTSGGPGDTGTTAGEPTTAPVTGSDSSSGAGTTLESTSGTTTTTPEPTTFLTNNPSTDDTADSESGFPPPPPPENRVCIAYLEHADTCFPGSPYNAVYAYYCDVYIQYGMRLDGPACVAALEAMYACFAMTECDLDPFEECSESLAAAFAACPNLFESPGETDTDTDASSTGGSDTGTDTDTSSTG
ncbi:MAG: hypothetical protein JNL82_11825 [Myxococcales bacterium]|nr:hypothetical protein [Myxococcales bacterium]